MSPGVGALVVAARGPGWGAAVAAWVLSRPPTR